MLVKQRDGTNINKKPAVAKAMAGEGGPSWDQGRALKNSPVGYFSEGASLQGRLDPSERKQKRQSDDCLARGPSWDRTSDPLIMSQVL